MQSIRMIEIPKIKAVFSGPLTYMFPLLKERE